MYPTIKENRRVTLIPGWNNLGIFTINPERKKKIAAQYLNTYLCNFCKENKVKKELNENHNEQSKMIFKLYTDKDPMLSFFIIASTSFQNPGKERRRYTENSKLFK